MSAPPTCELHVCHSQQPRTRFICQQVHTFAVPFSMKTNTDHTLHKKTHRKTCISVSSSFVIPCGLRSQSAKLMCRRENICHRLQQCQNTLQTKQIQKMHGFSAVFALTPKAPVVPLTFEKDIIGCEISVYKSRCSKSNSPPSYPWLSSAITGIRT